MEKVNVLVIGAGIMGHSIAMDFAAHGYPTTYDKRTAEMAKKLVAGNVSYWNLNMITVEGVKNVDDLFVYTDKLEDAASAKFVVEAVPEVP